MMSDSDSPSRRMLPRWAWLAMGVIVAYLLAAYIILPQLDQRDARRHPDLRDGARLTHTGNGLPGDPLNICLVGSKEEVIRALLAAGWRPANPLSLSSSVRIVVDTVVDKPDPNVPFATGDVVYFVGTRDALARALPLFEPTTGGSLESGETA